MQQLEQNINHLWKEQHVPEINQWLTNQYVPDNTPVVELLSLGDVRHCHKYELKHTQVEFVTFMGVQVSEECRTEIFIDGQGVVEACEKLQAQLKWSCRSALKKAGYQGAVYLAKNTLDAYFEYILQSYGNIQGHIETSTIKLIPHENLSRRIIVTMSAQLWIVKPKDVLSLAIKTPQKVRKSES